MTQSHFDRFLERHGEIAVLALLENTERYLGVCAPVTASLAQRWARLEMPAALSTQPSPRLRFGQSQRQSFKRQPATTQERQKAA